MGSSAQHSAQWVSPTGWCPSTPRQAGGHITLGVVSPPLPSRSHSTTLESWHMVSGPTPLPSQGPRCSALPQVSCPSCGSNDKESACNVEVVGSIPRLGRFPGEGNGNPLHYSCLETSMDRSLAGYSPWGHRVRHTFTFPPPFRYLYFRPLATPSLGLRVD